MSLVLLNKTASSSLWQAGQMTEKEKDEGRVPKTSMSNTLLRAQIPTVCQIVLH